MPTITTKSQSSIRAEKSEEIPEGSSASATRSTSASLSVQPSKQDSSPSSTWQVDEKGVYTGDGKHYGDTQPKVYAGSVAEALQMIKEVDPAAKIPEGKDLKAPVSVPSPSDTINTEIVMVSGKVVISGPTAGKIAVMRGLMLLGHGEGNPIVLPAEPAAEPEEKVNETDSTK